MNVGVGLALGTAIGAVVISGAVLAQTDSAVDPKEQLLEEIAELRTEGGPTPESAIDPLRDLARLYDGRQEVAAGIGGRPPAAFGLLVRDISGRRSFATQLPDRGRLRLTQAPHGVHASASAWTGRAYAGPFQDLRAAGIARGGGWTGRTNHRFTAFFVQTTWSLQRTGASGRATTC